jgi:hypothetical protein
MSNNTTFQNAKDRVAKKHGFDSWTEMMVHHNLNTLSSTTISMLVNEVKDILNDKP